MSDEAAKRAALAAFISIAAVVGWRSIQERGFPLPNFKTTVALTVLAAALAVGVDVAPEIVGPLSVLIALAIVVSRFPTDAASSKFLHLYSAAPSGSGFLGWAPTATTTNPATKTPPLMGGATA